MEDDIMIVKCSRGNGKSLALAEQVKKQVDNGKRVIFMRSGFCKDLEELKNYEPSKYDDVPDSVRYNMEYLGLWGDKK